ncbi:MAG: hypothetical protein HRU13_09730 [Phycisphaerales bacterium]|nr:hypothetical protein [Phycisphaerales bacterium]
MSQSLDLTLQMGTTYRAQIFYGPASAPIDITGATFTGAISTERYDGQVLLDLSPFLSVVDGPTGEAALVLPASTTDAFVQANGESRWPYDILINLSGGDTKPLLTGQAVTRGSAK